MIPEVIEEGLTFDDVLLQPAYSQLTPAEADTTTRLTPKIELKIPIISAAMDTVTESHMAIALAQQGGIGIIHRNMAIDRQAEEVDRVKRSESGMIVDPVTIEPERKISEALELMSRYRISGVPVTKNGRLVGILTNRDLRFETRFDLPIQEVMTKENLITVPVGTTLEDAEKILHQHRVEKLLVVDENYTLKGLITVKDIQKKLKYPNAAKDAQGRLRVAAAVGATGDFLERAHRTGPQESRRDRHRFGARPQPARDGRGENRSSRNYLKSKYWRVMWLLTKARAISSGWARTGSRWASAQVRSAPRASSAEPAYHRSPRLRSARRQHEKPEIPLIADGGVKFSGDITKAIAAGADSVMIGSLLAGTDESPGETILYQGRTFKSYRGMGSIGAMPQGSSDRYGQAANGKLVPEGIEGRVPYKGPLADLSYQLVGGLRSGMGYCGCRSITELQERARFLRVTVAGLRESHVHDVIITKEAPNYRLE